MNSKVLQRCQLHDTLWQIPELGAVADVLVQSLQSSEPTKIWQLLQLIQILKIELLQRKKRSQFPDALEFWAVRDCKVLQRRQSA